MKTPYQVEYRGLTFEVLTDAPSVPIYEIELSLRLCEFGLMIHVYEGDREAALKKAVALLYQAASPHTASCEACQQAMTYKILGEAAFEERQEGDLE